MKNFLENLIEMLPSRTHARPGLHIVKPRKSIQKILQDSVVSSNTVGIYCPALGEGMLLVGVEDVLTDSAEPVIVLKRYDLNGIMLQRTHVALSEIRSVCPFDTKYENPLLKKEAKTLIQ